MDEENFILRLLYGDAVSYRETEVVAKSYGRFTDEQIAAACLRLENKDLLYNEGDDMWEREDDEFQNIWKLTIEGIQVAGARCPGNW